METNYKAWDKQEEFFHAPMTIKQLFSLSSAPAEHIMAEGFRLIATQDDLEWIMGTGLNDKHGKEMYEGHIVKFVGGTAHYIQGGTYEKHPIGTIFVITRLRSGFTLQLPHHVGTDIPNLVGNVQHYNFWCHHRSFEIIGHTFIRPIPA